MPRQARQESIIEYFSGHEGYKCGYCKSATTNFSHGMWAHGLNPADYEALLKRGWRRSGSYMYKPTNNLTCCPMYTINCKALEFSTTKSQRKVLRKFNQYLLTGELKAASKYEKLQAMDENISGVGYREGVVGDVSVDTNRLEQVPTYQTAGSSSEPFLQTEQVHPSKSGNSPQRGKSQSSGDSESIPSGPASAPSSSGRQKGKKARDIRIERKKLKLIARGVDPASVFTPRKPQEAKTIEELTKDLPDAKVKFQVKLVKTDTPEFQEMIALEHKLYRKYQMSIHGDTAEECTPSQYKRFLCDNPLNVSANNSTGAYHQQYYMNDKLVAVGVIDILPSCLSSVYFFYDPELMGLSLGTYGALKEIAFVRELSKVNHNMKNYYMGFYIHSCVKMRYKGSYSPSYLLCPETYTWKLLDETLRNKLSLQKYCRLGDSGVPAESENRIEKVQILHRGTILPYSVYELKRGHSDKGEIQEYCNLVGEVVAGKLLLYRA